MGTNQKQVAEAAERLRAHLDEVGWGDNSHDLKGDFAMIRNWAELRARARDRDEEEVG